MVGLLSCVDSDVPSDLLSVACGILAVSALVQSGSPMRTNVLLKHQLVPAGEAANLALEGLVLRRASLVLVQQVLGQELPLLGGEGALGAQLGEVGPAVLLEALWRVKAHLAGGAT